MNYQFKKSLLLIVPICILSWAFAQQNSFFTTGFKSGKEQVEHGESFSKVSECNYYGNRSLIETQDKSNNGEVIFEEEFSYPDGPLPPHFWSEGNKAVIKDGRLFMDADLTDYRASTVWLDRKFSGNIRIRFDVQVVASGDTANNINCFLMYSDPSGKYLRESKDQREDGVYNHYHKLNGYIITFLANRDQENARVRFRDNPGFNLLAENFGNDCKAGKTYHIKIEKMGSRFQYWVNEVKLLDTVDDKYNVLHDEGFFGFRTWHTALWWDNLVVTRLE